MGFQSNINQIMNTTMGAVAGSQLIAGQRQSNKEQEKATRLQEAQLTLSAYSDALKDEQRIDDDLNKSAKELDEATENEIYAENVYSVATQDKDLIEKKYNKQAQDILATGDPNANRKIFSLAGKKQLELNNKYTPYRDAYFSAQQARSDAELRYNQISEQYDVIQERLNILKERKSSVIDNLQNSKGGTK